jgi:FixJ family two-component response regulator
MSLIPKKGTVYVVDDDEAVRDSLQWLLEGKDYRVRCFDSASPSWPATTRAKWPA